MHTCDIGEICYLSVHDCVAIVVVAIIMWPSFFFSAPGAHGSRVDAIDSPGKLAKYFLN